MNMSVTPQAGELGAGVSVSDYRFDEKKATRAASFFAKKFEGEINYMKLIKLLYLTDRESIKRTGFPIAGGQYVSMDYGPVTSPIYEAVQEKKHFPLWSCFFKKSGYDVRLINDPGEDFSKSELDTLEFIFERFGSMTEWDLVKFTHDNCPEWMDPQGTSNPIPSREILKRVGKSDEQILGIAEEQRRLDIMDSSFLASE